ncbi:hypothetical protein TNCV_537731 [Trichonephila clavipes]|nr:hypothetical protein TNCV_537731 [Trichonephila clavipes]
MFLAKRDYVRPLSDVKRGILLGARLTGTSVSNRAMLVGISRTTVLSVLTAYTCMNSHSGRTSRFQDDNAPVHKSRCVQIWLHEHDDEVEHLTWCPSYLI